MTKQDRELLDDVFLQPWFLPRDLAFAIRRMLPPEHRHRMRFFFDDYGCMRCGTKDAPYVFALDLSVAELSAESQVPILSVQGMSAIPGDSTAHSPFHSPAPHLRSCNRKVAAVIPSGTFDIQDSCSNATLGRCAGTCVEALNDSIP